MNSPLGYVGISDVIDVIATSVLIYYVLVLIRGTRAVQILIGILVLVGLLGIATLFHLVLLGTILRLILVGAAVSIPIVFQPELRRALEQIGRGGLFRMEDDRAELGRGRTEDRTIAALARAAFLLGRGKRGALIVIEQQSGLKDYCETGTALHADVSVELLVTIFAPASPLHDGAVIVREGRVEAARCLLPLSEQAPSKSLGTRHRAALGLSEQTDAVVIVVSEQTGSISIARSGRLSRPIDDEARLTRMLLAVTRPPRRQRRRNDLIAHLRSRLRLSRGEPASRVS